MDGNGDRSPGGVACGGYGVSPASPQQVDADHFEEDPRLEVDGALFTIGSTVSGLDAFLLVLLVIVTRGQLTDTIVPFIAPTLGILAGTATALLAGLYFVRYRRRYDPAAALANAALMTVAWTIPFGMALCLVTAFVTGDVGS